MTTLHKTVSTPAGDGITTWTEDNSIAVLLDDGIEYVFDETEVSDADDQLAGLRMKFWNLAHYHHDDFFEACEFYSNTIKRFNHLRNNAGKTCSKCGEFKAFYDFHASAESSDGLRPDCKQCRKV